MNVRPVPPLLDAETTMTGSEESTPHGPVWLVRATYPAHFRHGGAALASACAFAPGELALVTREPAAAAVAPEGWVVLDVESTGLGARAGTMAFLIGIGAWVDDAFVVEQLFLRDPGDEAALLHAASERLRRATGVLTFNGKSFDLPLLATRCALVRAVAAVQPHPHCDLLHAARRLWGGAAGDCRLSALEHRLLGVRRTHDVAGRDVPDLYLEYLRRNDPTALDAVLRHNRADLLSLLLLTAAAARLPAHARESGDEGGAAAALRARAARLYAEAGDPDRATELFTTCLGPHVPLAARQAARGWLARRAVRQGAAAAACALWQAMLADEPDLVEPYEALAKTFEHRLGDPAQALVWVEERLGGASLAAPAASDLAHRRARLVRKLGGLPQAPSLSVPGAAGASAPASTASLDDRTRTLLPYASPEATRCPPSQFGHPVEANDS